MPIWQRMHFSVGQWTTNRMINSISLQSKDHTSSFEDIWPAMRPIVLKVLKQEPVTQAEWQDLFYGVHLVCMWDEKGPTKIHDCLHEDIVAFITVSGASLNCLSQFVKIYDFPASSGSSVGATRGTGAAKGVHCRMAEILYPKQLLAVAVCQSNARKCIGSKLRVVSLTAGQIFILNVLSAEQWQPKQFVQRPQQ